MCVCVCEREREREREGTKERVCVSIGVSRSPVLQCVAVCCSELMRTCSACALFGALVWVERWGAGVETQKSVRGEIGGWGREPFHENYAPSLSTIYDGA